MSTVPVTHISPPPPVETVEERFRRLEARWIAEVGFCSSSTEICGNPAFQEIVILHEMRGLSPAEIVDYYPGITVADVHASLAYYFDHHDEIETDFQNDEQWSKYAEANHPSLIVERPV